MELTLDLNTIIILGGVALTCGGLIWRMRAMEKAFNLFVKNSREDRQKMWAVINENEKNIAVLKDRTGGRNA